MTQLAAGFVAAGTPETARTSVTVARAATRAATRAGTLADKHFAADKRIVDNPAVADSRTAVADTLAGVADTAEANLAMTAVWEGTVWASAAGTARSAGTDSAAAVKCLVGQPPS